MLCSCFSYTRDEVEMIISHHDLKTVEELTDKTMIGIGCSGCLEEVQELFQRRAEGEG